MQWALQGDSRREEVLWRRSELGGIGREGSSSVAVQHFVGKSAFLAQSVCAAVRAPSRCASFRTQQSSPTC
jgi:hypothetical protein